jgi:mono/diheme cytochrome c family protein
MTEKPVVADATDAPPATYATPGGAGAWLVGALIGAIVVGLIIAAWIAGKDEGRRQAGRESSGTVAKTAPASTRSLAAAGPGKQLFVAKCGSCHTLKDAGSTGAVGPNLDDLQPDAAQVLAALKNGGAGSGTMPPLIYQGEQARALAEYVAAAGGGG